MYHLLTIAKDLDFYVSAGWKILLEKYSNNPKQRFGTALDL